MKYKKYTVLGLFLLGMILLPGEVLGVEPIEKTFTITGYYSPLPNQNFYVTGNYEAEIRLNGRGIRGADGMGVYPGMMAAPRSIAFGTRICVPSFGCGTVHDRGQAIVQKGERAIAVNDRLDLWMGYGEEGLLRALAWGMRHIPCEVYPEGSGVAETVNFDLPLALHQIVDIPGKEIFTANLYRGMKHEEVTRLQQSLQDLGFYEGDLTGVFDQILSEAVFTFQKRHLIVESWEAYGAGGFGPQTRERLSEALYQHQLQKNIAGLWDSFHFVEALRKGLRNEAVLRLQQILVQRELLEVSPTAYFGPSTLRAVKTFQLKHNIIDSLEAPGAGRVGPVTMMKLNDLLSEREVALSQEKEFIAQEESLSQRWRVLSRKPLREILPYAWLGE